MSKNVRKANNFPGNAINQPYNKRKQKQKQNNNNGNNNSKQDVKSSTYLSHRDLGGNQIEKIPLGVFYNNTELVYLYVTDSCVRDWSVKIM